MTKTTQKLTLDQKIIETLKKMIFYKTPDNSLYSPPDNTYKYKIIETGSAEFIGRVRKEFYDKHGVILKDKAIEQARLWGVFGAAMAACILLSPRPQPAQMLSKISSLFCWVGQQVIQLGYPHDKGDSPKHGLSP